MTDSDEGSQLGSGDGDDFVSSDESGPESVEYTPALAPPTSLISRWSVYVMQHIYS